MTINNIDHIEFNNKRVNIQVTITSLKIKLHEMAGMLDLETGNMLHSLNVELDLILCKINNFLDTVKI